MVNKYNNLSSGSFGGSGGSKYAGKKVFLNIRITPRRRAALEEAARMQEKTLTQVVEEMIDMYLIGK